MNTKMKKRGYGYFMQDGGQVPGEMSVDQQMMMQEGAAPEQGDPQAMAEEFIAAFQQLPPEAQQMVHQAIMEMTQG